LKRTSLLRCQVAFHRYISRWSRTIITNGDSMKRPILIAVSLLTVGVAPLYAQIAGERPVSIPVYAAVTSVTAAAIGSNGDQFLAAWIDRRDRAAVYAARNDRDGTLLDATGIFIASAENGPVGVAWNADSYVVIWQTSSGVFATRIASDGTIADPAHLILPGAQIDAQSPIAANGNAVVVAYAGGYSVLDHQLRVTSSGSFAGTPSVWITGANEFTLIATGNVSNPRSVRLDSTGHFVSLNLQAGPAASAGGAISCHGQNCVWASDHLSTFHLAVASYDPIAQTSGAPIDLPIAEGSFVLAATSGGYVLVTSTGAVQRLDLQGAPNGSPTPPCCHLDGVAAVSNGRDAAVLRRSGTLTLTMMSASSDGETRNVAVSASAQHGPALATNLRNDLVVWTESSGIYARRLDPDGTLLDFEKSSRRTLSQASGLLPPEVSVLFDKTSYIAAVSTNFDRSYTVPSSSTITTLRIDPDTGSTQTLNTICGNDMRIANNGSASVATWVDCNGKIAVALLNVDGALASPPIFLASSNLSTAAGPFVAKPSLAWNGTEWLVIWEEQTVVTVNSQLVPVGVAIRGSRLTNALTPLDPDPVLTISSGNNPLMPSRVASDGHDFLAVWSIGSVIHARRITAAGAVLDDQQEASGFVQDLIWDGSSYSMAFLTPDLRILALLRMRATGQLIESQIISATPDEKRSAALLAVGGGHVIAAYTRVAHESLYGGVERAFIAAPSPLSARRRAVRSVSP
jgi:hypothetical protein